MKIQKNMVRLLARLESMTKQKLNKRTKKDMKG